MRKAQQIGGVAAIVFAIAVAAEMALFLLVVPALGSSLSDLNDPAKYAKLLAHGQVPFVLEGSLIALASAFAFALVHALDERIRLEAPERAAAAAAFGYAGYTLLLVTFEVRVSLALDTQHAEQAIPGLTILGSALGAGGGVLLGAWVFTVSLSAMHSRALPKLLSYYGLLVAIALLISGATPPVFIPLLLPWSLWVGVVLLRQPTGRGLRKRSLTIPGAGRRIVGRCISRPSGCTAGVYGGPYWDDFRTALLNSNLVL